MHLSSMRRPHVAAPARRFPSTSIPSEVTVFKKLLAALGITGALYWLAKKRRQGDEFTFSDPSDS